MFLSFVVAPGAFSLLGNRDAAGMMVGYSLIRLHFAGIFLGLLFLVARLLRTRDFASFTTAAALCVVFMVILTAASQFTVSNRMERLKKQMVSVQNTPDDDPSPRPVQSPAPHFRSLRRRSPPPRFRGIIPARQGNASPRLSIPHSPCASARLAVLRSFAPRVSRARILFVNA